jgi:uncharacterized membrane protein YphA (DoxX/SURF4 family)
MNAVLIIGRVLFALMCVNGGINHFTKLAPMTGYAQFKKVPAAKLGVIVSGLMLLLGGLGVILGVYMDLSAILLAVVLVAMSVMMHDFWKADAAAKQSEMIGFFKNISMAGASLIIFAAIAGAEKGARVLGPMMTNGLWHK